MQIVRHRHDLQQALARVKNEEASEGARIGFVPTMGALHDGHLSLVAAAKQHSDVVVASIFVNPTQFAAGEDFGSYPRQHEADIAALEEAGTDIVYLPERNEIYHEDTRILVADEAIATTLEGEFRPHFFGGVKTVVAELFKQVQPDIACFGEKDYQQLAVIRRMVAMMNLPMTIIGVPTMREASGLAMSSRNAYLNVREREIAANLYRILQQAAFQFRDGLDAKVVEAQAIQDLIAIGFHSVDYLTICDAETLQHAQTYDDTHTYRVLGAAYLGTTRLIDNVGV